MSSTDADACVWSMNANSTHCDAELLCKSIFWAQKRIDLVICLSDQAVDLPSASRKFELSAHKVHENTPLQLGCGNVRDLTGA